ncbi:MAG: hypothetical protein GXO88_05755 [Chlorobi bacterium]|nr:hypothetical protein [Chlorobiota bacterium]
MNPEIKSIINHSLEYAEDMLGQNSELHPFAAFTDKKGQVHPLEMEIDNKNIPPNGKIIETLWDYCKTELDERKITAFGISFESALQLEEGADSVDVVVIIPDHIDEGGLPAYCTPFKVLGEENIEFGEMFAVDKKFFN